MKRRNFLKKLTATAAGGVLCSQASVKVLAAQEGQASSSPKTKVIRGLIEKDGKLWQPIQFSFQHAGEATTAVVKVDGIERGQQKVATGTQTLEVLIPPVDTERTAQVSVEVAGQTLSASATVKPVRKVTTYILIHSHNDIGFTDSQAVIEERQMRNLRVGIDLARQTARYPKGSQFIWNVEVLWGADLYMQRMSPADRAEFIDAVRKGWVGLNGMYSNELTGLCRPEELLQMFRYSTQLADQCGVRIDSAMISDVPGYTWGTVTAMAQAGIRYFSPAPNWFDRIGSFMEEWQDKPFWWVSPSGKETEAKMEAHAQQKRNAGPVKAEDVLSDSELELLAQAKSGQVSCPWCKRPLTGEFLYIEVPEDDYYAGVKLSCKCGFVEY